MTPAKIIAPVTGTPHDGVVIRTALAAAKPFRAHVQTIFVHPDPRMIPYVGLPVTPEVVQSIINANEEMLRAAAKSARAAFAAAADESNARIAGQPERSDAVTASFVERKGYFVDVVERASLLADLVAFPPFAHGDNPEAFEGFTRILTRLERPVLLSAEMAPTSLGTRVAVGWDGGVAAAHALSAALPWLAAAKSVELVSVKHSGAGSSENAKAYLQLHGVACTVAAIDPAGRAVADALMDAASSSKCDLLVMGGYGHSRLSETVFGGVTQHVAAHPKLPVFMTH